MTANNACEVLSRRRDKTKWDRRRSDNDDNVDDRYHGGASHRIASSMLTRRDFRGYNLNEKGDITRGRISLMRAYDLLYCAGAAKYNKYLILRYESGMCLWHFRYVILRHIIIKALQEARRGQRSQRAPRVSLFSLSLSLSRDNSNL